MSSAIEAFDYSVNILRSLLWRHNQAVNLTALEQAKQAWYDANVTQFWTDWETDVFDLRTCNDFGCAVWAIILNLPLTLIVPPNAGPQFGFGPSSNGRQNFDNGNFGVSASGVNLTLAQKRIVLQLQYYRLISRCTVPEMNKFLKAILGDQGSVYVLDGNDMSYVTYVFGFTPSSALQFVLENFDVLPRPAAVGVRIVVSTRPVFGFGPYNQNFDNGTFAGS